MMRIELVLASTLLLAGGPHAPPASRQEAAVHRTTLQEQLFPAPNFHTITIKAVIDPSGTVAAHTHPGAEMAYVESGSATLTVDGAPPRTVAAGDSFSIIEGTVHKLTNDNAAPLTVISTYVVERGKPVANPVHQVVN